MLPGMSTGGIAWRPGGRLWLFFLKPEGCLCPLVTQKASFVLIVFSVWNYVLLHHSSCRQLLHPGVGGTSKGIWIPGYTMQLISASVRAAAVSLGPAASPRWLPGAAVDTGTGTSSVSISACGCSWSQRPRAASAQAAGRRGRQKKKSKCHLTLFMPTGGIV